MHHLLLLAKLFYQRRYRTVNVQIKLGMHGLMQDWPLVVTNILDYAAKWHGEQEVITCTAEGPIHRYTYADMHRRSQLCALALQRLGLRYAA